MSHLNRYIYIPNLLGINQHRINRGAPRIVFSVANKWICLHTNTANILTPSRTIWLVEWVANKFRVTLSKFAEEPVDSYICIYNSQRHPNRDWWSIFTHTHPHGVSCMLKVYIQCYMFDDVCFGDLRHRKFSVCTIDTTSNHTSTGSPSGLLMPENICLFWGNAQIKRRVHIWPFGQMQQIITNTFK